MNTTGKKHGGRAKGTPNKLTREIRTSLKNILNNEIEQLPAHFEKLEPKERIELLIKIMPYAMPQVKPEVFEVSENGISDMSW